VPAGTPRGRLCVPQNYIRVRGIDDDVEYDVFQGIIKSARTSVESPDTLTVQGTCLLGELANRSVLELELVERIPELPPNAVAPLILGGAWMRGLDPPADNRTDWPNVRDGNPATTNSIAHWSYEKESRRHILYLGQEWSFDTVVWDIDSVGVLHENSPDVQYWDNAKIGWETQTLTEDTTVDTTTAGEGTGSLGQSGEWHFNPQPDWGPSDAGLNNVPHLYWLRVSFPGPLGDLGEEFTSHEGLVVSDIWTITTRPRHASMVLNDIMALAPPDWALDLDEGHAAVEQNVFQYFSGESVLQALIRVAEITGEHFRLGIGRRVVWLGNDTIDRGVQAIKPAPGHSYMAGG